VITSCEWDENETCLFSPINKFVNRNATYVISEAAVVGVGERAGDRYEVFIAEPEANICKDVGDRGIERRMCAVSCRQVPEILADENSWRVSDRGKCIGSRQLLSGQMKILFPSIAPTWVPRGG
jgi:hypothetical protein